LFHAFGQTPRRVGPAAYQDEVITMQEDRRRTDLQRRHGASRRSRIEPFMAMDVMSQAAALERAGRSVVHLEVGEPGLPAPLAVRQAAMRALEAGRIGYTEALGMPGLRQRIATHYGESYGVTLSPERVAVTTGSSGGFILAFLALFDVGARVAIAAPGYPAYRNILDALGIEVVTIETSARTRHVVTAEAIAAEHRRARLDGVLLMSPANPTGTMMSRDDLRDIARFCEDAGIAFISDAIYHGLTYERPAETALAFSDTAVVVNSFSKYYCMTGWRVGWLVLPQDLVRPVERLQQSLSISVPTLSQIAATAAFEARPELEAIREAYARNRARLLEELPAMGLGDFHPIDGAFYAYVDIGRFTNDSVDFCRRMLVEAGVAATPGIDFDRLRGHRTMRLSFAGSAEDVEGALARLRDWLPR
jgi:aspartate/methionine/tyrosine aminotransferase